MKHTYLRYIYLLLILVLGFKTGHATITVDSVHVTLSTCPNNGTAKVYARSTNSNAVFLFNITSGPVTYNQQNDSTFYSLYPGSYTGWVHDVNSFDSAQFAFTVAGNYIAPVVSAGITSPVCISGNEGEITGQLVPGTGVQPYTWQIISPDSLAPQSNATFSNLAPGSYTIRVNDGCGIARTASTYIDSADLGFTYTYLQMTFLTCNTAQRIFVVTMDTDRASIPLKVTTTTSNGSFIHYIATVSRTQGVNPGGYYLFDTVSNIHYGDYFKVCISDTCSNVICYARDSITHFRFTIDYTTENINCVNGYAGNVSILPGSQDISVLGYLPITTILTDTLNHVVVDSFTNAFDGYYQCGNCTLIPPQSDSIPYLLTVKDGCGNVYTQNVKWPAPVSLHPSVYSYNQGSGCVDSTWLVEFLIQGFNSGATFELLSGPSVAESSFPGFVYRDTIIYPLNYTVTSSNFLMGNIPPGKYIYNVHDSCGASITDTVVLQPAVSLEFHTAVTSGCDGLSSMKFFSPRNGPVYNASLIDLNTGGSFYPVSIDTIVEWVSLRSGTYMLIVDYSEIEGGINFANINCWTYAGTIIIPAFNDSTFRATAVAACNGVINLSIIVDSANGLPPYRYEIISGPSTFPFQNSPTFVVDSFGTYLVAVMDSCGDIDARYVTVDTGRFDPIGRTGGLCAGGAAKLFDVSSPYFTYTWYKPGGGIYTGDTLTINLLTDADTGVYFVKKIVQINGCRDSAFSSYHFLFEDIFYQSVTICPNTNYYIGNNVHNIPGIYYDTLTGAYGCDSIVITNLSNYTPLVSILTPMLPTCSTDTITLTAVNGNSNTIWSIGDNDYGNGINELSITISTDTVVTIYLDGVDSIGCFYHDSIVVYPSPGYAINTPYLCHGDTFYVGNHFYTQTGNYTDTIVSRFGCDSIVYTHLTVYPLDSIYSNQNLCQGQVITINNRQYSQAGLYLDTLSNIHGCDSVLYISVTVKPNPQASITTSDSSKCNYTPVTLSAFGGATYLWQPGNISSQSIVVNPQVTTLYKVTVTDTGLCTGVDSILVYPLIGTLNISDYTNVLVCPGNYLSYTWYLNGQLLQGQTSDTLILNGTGSYTVQVTDSNGCVITSNAYIVSGINNITAPSISVSPNPNNTNQWQVTVSAELANAQCQVFDVDGKAVYTILLTGTNNTIKTNLAAGTYIMRISNGQNIYNIKLVQF